MSSHLEQRVREALEGDRDALESMVREIQPTVFGLAFRMLGFPQDAEDATQEILVKVVTHLGDFRGESAFRSWVYRIACNHLLNTRKRRAERMGIDFELWERLIYTDVPDAASRSMPDAEKALLTEEVRIGCMQGLLLALDRDHRMAVVLGEIFEVTGEEGADILGITPEAFRKRLSRGRQRIHGFMHKNCALVRSDAPCRCSEQADRDLATGWIDPESPRFTPYVASPEEQSRVLKGLQEIEEMARTAYLYRHYPAYRPPSAFPLLVKEMIEDGRLPLLNG